MKDGRITAHVIEALCKGCGVCGTAYPIKAISMGHFTKEEVSPQVKATLLGETMACARKRISNQK